MDTPHSNPSVSIIVPTYNREETLCNTIQDLLELHDQFSELLVVDQTREHLPDTLSFLSSLPEKVRIIKLSAPDLTKARNRGAREARSEIVLYLDDDIKPLPTLIRSHIRHYQDPTIGGIAGHVKSAYGIVRGLDSRYHTSAFPWRYIRFDQDWDLCEVVAAPGGNMSFRRALIFEAGGFDEQFVGNAYREETDFCLRLRKMSYRILFDPDAALIHYGKTDGGCEHFRFADPNRVSFLYYKDFIQNNAYFIFKHVPRASMPEFIWELYRNHIGNKFNLRQGLNLFFFRHVAFVLGLFGAYRAWRRQNFLYHSDIYLSL